MMGHDPRKNYVQRGVPCCSGKKVSAFVMQSVVCVVVFGCVCVVAVVVVMVLYMGDGHDPFFEKNL